MAKQLLGVMVEPETKTRLEEVAKGRGLSPSEATREALELWMGMDDGTYGDLADLAKTHGMTIAEVVHRLVLCWLAREDSRRWVMTEQGKQYIRLYSEFSGFEPASDDPREAAKHFRGLMTDVYADDLRGSGEPKEGYFA